MNIFQEFKEVAKEETLNELSQGAMIQKAIDIASSMAGNYTGAVKRIEAIKRGLSKNKNVEKALRLANEEVIGENYRTLAQKGMGTESEKDARVGLELDFYDSQGNKQFGKIVKKDNKGYTVKDSKGKTHTFMFLDRQKAKKLLVKTDKLSNIIKKNTIQKGKFAGYMTDEVEEAVSPAQQAAIAIAKKEKEEKNESVFNSYRRMVEMWLDEEVANITVDPNNKIPTPADQNKHSLEIVKQARRFGIKASQLGKHIRIKGNKKAVNDFLRIVIGRSSYGDPTEKDTSTPQIDKMLTKGLK